MPTGNCPFAYLPACRPLFALCAPIHSFLTTILLFLFHIHRSSSRSITQCLGSLLACLLAWLIPRVLLSLPLFSRFPISFGLHCVVIIVLTSPCPLLYSNRRFFLSSSSLISLSGYIQCVCLCTVAAAAAYIPSRPMLTGLLCDQTNTRQKRENRLRTLQRHLR